MKSLTAGRACQALRSRAEPGNEVAHPLSAAGEGPGVRGRASPTLTTNTNSMTRNLLPPPRGGGLGGERLVAPHPHPDPPSSRRESRFTTITFQLPVVLPRTRGRWRATVLPLARSRLVRLPRTALPAALTLHREIRSNGLDHPFHQSDDAS